MSSSRIFKVILVIWLVLFAASFILYFLTEPTGSGFTRGLNRVPVFFGWQGVALVAGIFLFIKGRQLPEGGGLQKLRWAPFMALLLLVLLTIGLVFYQGVIADRDRENNTPPGPVTEPAPVENN